MRRRLITSTGNEGVYFFLNIYPIINCLDPYFFLLDLTLLCARIYINIIYLSSYQRYQSCMRLILDAISDMHKVNKTQGGIIQ
jgi:hypothetical protein